MILLINSTYSLKTLICTIFFFQDSDGEKSDQDLVVDVANEVWANHLSYSFK